MDIQDWVEAYKEICPLVMHPTQKSLGIPEIGHIDLWREQIDYDEESYPWANDSLFINFNTLQNETTGNNIQDCVTEVSFIYAKVCMASSFHGSDNQNQALEFGYTNRKIHKMFQGRSGVNFSNMDRVRGPRRLPSPYYLLVYEQVYKCIIRDMTAMDEPAQALLTGTTLRKQTITSAVDDSPLFTIPTD